MRDGGCFFCSALLASTDGSGFFLASFFSAHSTGYLPPANIRPL